MTTWTATFTTDEDGEELMYKMEREFGIEFDEFHEVPDAPKPVEREPFYDDFRYGSAVLSVPNVRKDEIAATGRVQVIAKADEFWGGGETKDYASSVMLNPTWEDLTKVLDEQMKVTRDFHHQFLEDIGVVDPPVDGVKIIRLGLGS